MQNPWMQLSDGSFVNLDNASKAKKLGGSSYILFLLDGSTETLSIEDSVLLEETILANACVWAPVKK